MPKAVYIQFTNPELYPPLEHGSKILVEHGWRCTFYGRRHAMTGTIVFPELEGRRVHVLPKWSMRLPTKVEYFLYAAWVVVNVARRRPDVIYTSDPLAAPLGWLFLRLGFKVVYHEHDTPDRSLAKWIQRARRRLLRSALCSVIPNAARIAHEGLDIRELLEVRNYPAKDEVVPLEQAERKESAVVRLVYFGTLVPSRLPVSFFESLDACGLDIQVDLMGYETVHSQGYAQVLIERFRGAAHLRIEFLGAFSRKELLERAAQADAGLLLFSNPEDTNEGAMAGASNKIGDYLAAGIPMVCFRTQEFERLSEEVNGLHSWNAEVEFAEFLRGIKAASSEDQTRQALQEQIRTRMNYETEFEPVLKRLLEGLNA